MSSPTSSASSPAGENEVRSLYEKLLDSWNNRNAADFAALFEEHGNCVGFDGSQLDGRAAIESELARIFADHTPARYVARVREVRSLAAEVVLLRAVAGMVPPGKTDLEPSRNAIQSLVINKTGNQWQIAVFQNTPAQFDGRPELAEQLTNELRQMLP